MYQVFDRFYSFLNEKTRWIFLLGSCTCTYKYIYITVDVYFSFLYFCDKDFFTWKSEGLGDLDSFLSLLLEDIFWAVKNCNPMDEAIQNE